MAKKIRGEDYNFPYDIPQYFVVALVDRRPSSYMLEASGATEGEVVPIDTARAKKVKRISSVMVLNEKSGQWEVKKTRFIRGCPTIWVDEQKDYINTNPAQDGIWLESGSLNFSVEGNDIQKAMFLMLHENNQSFTGNDKYRRPEGAEDVFFCIDTLKEAEEVVEDFDIQVKAQNYLARLKQSGKTKGEVVYNTDLLEFLAALFNLPAQQGGYGAETFVALIARANDNPAAFLKKIGDQQAVTESDMNKALAAKVISIDELGVSVVSTGKMIMSFDGGKMSSKEQRLQLLEFLLNPSNRKHYDMVRALTNDALLAETGLEK